MCSLVVLYFCFWHSLSSHSLSGEPVGASLRSHYHRLREGVREEGGVNGALLCVANTVSQLHNSLLSFACGDGMQCVQEACPTRLQWSYSLKSPIHRLPPQSQSPPCFFVRRSAKVSPINRAYKCSSYVTSTDNTYSIIHALQLLWHIQASQTWSDYPELGSPPLAEGLWFDSGQATSTMIFI